MTRAVVERLSRYEFCTRQIDEDGRLFLDARKPYRFRAFTDNRTHVVQAGDTLFNIAGLHFQNVSRGAGLWWVIADFQPVPLFDPTVRLTPGMILVLPSLRTVMGEIFSESRRLESRL